METIKLFEKYGLEHLSASQLKTHERNPFVWVCEKVLGRRSPDSEATAFGSFLHEHFEKWLGSKTLPHEAVIQPALIEGTSGFHIDAWNDKVLLFYAKYKELALGWPDFVECDIHLDIGPDFPPIIGRIDALTLDGSTALVQDHKTIGNKRFAYSEGHELASDDQLMIYAAWVLTEYPQIERVVVQHDQIFKKLKREPVRLLNTELLPDKVWKHMEKIQDQAQALADTLRLYDEIGLTAFAAECAEVCEFHRYDYGGCPHYEFAKEQRRKPMTRKPLNEKVVDLHEIVYQARTFADEEHFANVFEKRDEMVELIMENILAQKINLVRHRKHVALSGDPLYGLLLNRLAEAKIKTEEYEGTVNQED